MSHLRTLAFCSTSFLAACGGGGGSKSTDPPITPNTPPSLQVPAGLAGSSPSYNLTLPIAQTQSLTFLATDDEGGALTWQVSTDTAAAAAAGVTYTLPHIGGSFTMTIAAAVAPIAVDFTIFVEDARGAASAIDLHLLRSGPPSITSVRPGSAFTTRAQQVSIRGAALRLGGSANTTASFDSLAATGLTIVSDSEVRCATPTSLATGPTVAAVSTQFGSASLPGSAFTAHAFPPDLFTNDVRIDAGSASSLEFAREGNTVHAVWLEGTAVAHRVSTDKGASWSSSLTLSGAEAASEPQVLVLGSEVLVAWIGDGTSVWSRRSSDGGASFAVAQRLDPASPVTPAQRVRIAASGNDRFAAWIAGATGAGQVVAVASADAGVAWTAPNLVAPGGSNQRNHALACDGSTAWVVLEDDRLGAPARGAYAARTIDGGSSWQTAVRLNLANTAAAEVGLAAAGDRVYATWLQNGGLSLSTSGDRGGTWSTTIVELQSSQFGTVSQPALFGTDSQLVTAFVVGGTSIRTATFTPLGASVLRTTVDSSAPASAEPRVAASGNYVFVAWREGDVGAGSARIDFAVSTDSGSTFEAPTGFGDGIAAQTAPRLVLDGANVLFGWIDARGATSGVFVNRTEF